MRIPKDWKFIERPSGVHEPSSETVATLWEDSIGLQCEQVGEPEMEHFRLRFASDIAFDVLVKDRTVVNRSARILPQSTIEHLLADQVAPRLNAFEGAFVLHAAVIAIDNQAVAIMGHTGSGKSTLAASFRSAGHDVLGDDACVVSWIQDDPRIRAVYPSLRLYEDSIKALYPTPPATAEMAHYSSKRRIEVSLSARDLSDMPLSAAFLLRAASNDDIDLAALRAADACVEFLRNSFALDPTNPRRAEARLSHAARLADRIPLFLLTYPHDYKRLPNVREAIADQLAQPA